MDYDDVSIRDDSNLDDGAYVLSSQNKLEISNEVSISETNIVNSQNDNLEASSVLSTANSEEKNMDLKISNNEVSKNANADKEVVTATNTVSKVPVNMSVISAVSDGSKTVFKVKLTDSENGKAVSGYKVNIIVTGKNLVGTTDNNGIAEITAKPLDKGTYSIALKFSGTISRYTATTATQNVVVTKKGSVKVPVKMTVTSAVTDGSKTVFKVKLTDSENGNVVAGYKTNIIVNGKNLVGTTDKSGVAEITAGPLTEGTYSVTLKFSGTISRYTATTLTEKVSVTKKSAEKTQDKTPVKVPVKMTVTSAVTDGSKTVFKVKLTDSENGNVVAGYKTNIIVNGKNLVGTTDKSGVAEITAGPLSVGTYTVTLKFSGTISRYTATTTTQKVSVSKKSSASNAGTDKSKSVWINADLGSDEMKNAVAKLLKEKGWNVYVGETYSNAHYTDYFKVTSDYKYYITLYNGFCAGTVREAYSASIQNTLKSKGVQLVIMWDTEDWTKPDGMMPYRYGDFTGYNAARAWDDNFSKDDPSIQNVASWLKDNNAFYCANPTAEGLVSQFLAGGYFAASGK